MLYPLTIQTIANERVEESHRRAAHARRIREIRAQTRAETPRTRESRASRVTRRLPRLVTPRVAVPATRFPR
jgi:hypothetical protein